MNIRYVLAALCVCLSLVTAILRNRHAERARLITKLISSLLFCMIAFLAAMQRGAGINFQAMLMLLGLLLGFVGDILLGLDHFVPKENKTFMLLMGGVPFFFGHILYIALLLSYGGIRWWLLALLPLLPLAFLLLEKLQVMKLGKNLKLFMAYGLVLGCMMLSTINLALRGGPLGRLMWLPGVLFAISDTSLFFNSFGKEKMKRLLPIFSYTIMLPYYAAQAMFALAVAYL